MTPAPLIIHDAASAVHDRIFDDNVASYSIYSMVSFRLHAPAREVSLAVAFLLPLAFVGR